MGKRRLRRAWGKRFSQRSGIQVNKDLIKEYATRATFNTQKGMEQREQKRQYIEDQFVRLFGVQMAEWYQLYHAKHHIPDVELRKEYGEPALVDAKLLVEWRMEQLKKEEVLIKNHITIKREPDWLMELWYHSRRNKWFFLEIDMVEGVQRKSIIYKSRDRAMLALSEGRVFWIDKSPILPVSSH